jgi:hypothetical protein
MRPRARRPRPARRAVLIVCEGRNTEPRYFERLASALGLAATVKVEIHGAPGCTDPQGLVEFAVVTKKARALEARRDLTKAEFEEVWVVFDVEHPENGRQGAIPSAVQAALQEGLSLAISNPSFEVWYILHDRATPPGLTCSDDARPVLRKLVGQAIDKSRAVADALAAWAMPRTAVALVHGHRQDVLKGSPERGDVHVPTATGTGAHLAVQSLVDMSSDEAGKKRLGFPGAADGSVPAGR